MKAVGTLSPLFLLIVVMAGCTAPKAEPPKDAADVQLRDDNVFAPEHLTKASASIAWLNSGAAAHHTVHVQEPGAGKGTYLFDSGDLAPGARTAFDFPGPGTYDVFCLYHSQGANGDFSGGMVMRVTIS